MQVRARLRSRRSLVVTIAVALVLVPLSSASADPDNVQVDPDDVARHLAEIEIDPEELRVDPSEVQIDGPGSDELRADRERLEDRLDEIEMQVSAVVEEYNVAMVALEDVEADLSATEAELTELGAEADSLSEHATEHLRRMHKLGPSLELSAIFITENPSDAGAKSSTLRRVLTNQRSDLEELSATRTAVAAAEDRLAEQQTEASRRAEQVEAQRVELEATVASFQDELTELEQAISQAQAAEEAELRRLEEQRRAEAEARARREAESLAREDAVARAEREAQERREAEERRAAQEAQERRDAQERREAEERRAAERRRDEQAAAQQSSNSNSSSSSSGSSSSGSSGGSSSGGSGSSGSGGGSSDAPPATRRSAQVAVDTALAQVGKPYRWGATGPNSFDCPGLTSYAWRAAGVSIPRTSGAQYSGLTRVSRSQLQPGDLVFYNSPISHVAMYIGGDTIVEAPYTGANVRTASLSRRTPVGYARP